MQGEFAENSSEYRCGMHHGSRHSVHIPLVCVCHPEGERKYFLNHRIDSFSQKEDVAVFVLKLITWPIYKISPEFMCIKGMNLCKTVLDTILVSAFQIVRHDEQYRPYLAYLIMFLESALLRICTRCQAE